MSDDLKITQPEDPNKINVKQPWELNYWSKSFGVSKEVIVGAVEKVGPLVLNVKRHLGIN